jgi:hypothetical protein
LELSEEFEPNDFTDIVATFRAWNVRTGGRLVDMLDLQEMCITDTSTVCSHHLASARDREFLGSGLLQLITGCR